MRWALLTGAVLWSLPATAQDHPDHAGHAMPETGPVAESESMPDRGPADHSQMDHAAMGHAMPAPVAADELPPPRALKGPRHAADAVWGAEAMQPSREELGQVHGAITTGTVMLERFETRLSDGGEAYLWDAQGWYGGDLDKLWLKSEGEGDFGDQLEEAEIQALWSHAIGPFFDLQVGARFDFKPETRGHLVAGIQGLAPYMWEVDTALFLSDRGDLTARIEVEYDQKLTQRLILQPRAEVELSAQDIPDIAVGAGLSHVAAGLRLRYEIVPEFAPYIGVEYETALGDTADFARVAGEDPNGFVLLVGLRAWF